MSGSCSCGVVAGRPRLEPRIDEAMQSDVTARGNRHVDLDGCSGRVSAFSM